MRMGKKMKKLKWIKGYILSVLAIVLICFNIGAVTTKHKESTAIELNVKNNYNVLVISSYNEKNIRTTNNIKGLKKYFENKKDYKVNILTEFLDIKNRNDINYIDKFIRLLQVKYEKSPIDYIYTVDYEAFNILKEVVTSKESIFYQTPLIFSGVDTDTALLKSKDEYITGSVFGENIYKLFNLILYLHSNVEKINIILDESKYCNFIKDEINEVVKTHSRDDIELNFIQSNYINEIVEKISADDNALNTVNIIGGEYQYTNNEYLSSETTISVLKKCLYSPIYSIDETYLGKGIVGGYISNQEDIGTNIGKTIDKLINKQTNSINRVVTKQKEKCYIDYESIYEYDINPANLPKGIIVINRSPFELLLPKNIKYIIRLTIVWSILIVSVSFYFNISARVTRRKEKREEKLAKEREKLRSDYIINISHELRTPLNIIMNSIKLIENNIDNKNYVKSKLNNVTRNTNRLLKLVENIIQIQKIDLGVQKLSLDKCNVVEVVEEVFIAIVPYAKEKGIEVIFDTEEEEIISSIDIEKIQRVILNLLSNGIKFSKSYGKIYGNIRQLGKNVIIEIKDEGIGIPKDKLNEIFHRYYQVDSSLSRVNEGAGIGLSIVNDIIELHNGNICVDSNVGEGSRFIIKLPILKTNKQVVNLSERLNPFLNNVEIEMSDVIK